MEAYKSTKGMHVMACTLRKLLRSQWDTDSAEWIDRDLHAATELDWKLLIKTAQEARVSPLLHLILHNREWVPKHVRSTLRMDLFSVARQNLITLHTLAPVLRALSDADIPHIVLKGAALALTLYKNEGLRPMSDIDLLVQQNDVPHAVKVLSECGFCIAVPEIHPGARLKYDSELLLKSQNPVSPTIDLHWCLINAPHYHHTISSPTVWETAQPLLVIDVPSQTLAPEILLLHLAGHLVMQHHEPEGIDILWAHDIALLLNECTATLDWDTVFELAQAWDLVIPLQRLLKHTATVWHVPLPEVILSAVSRLQPSRAEQHLIHWRASDRKQTGIRTVVNRAGAIPSSQRLRYLLAQAFPSVHYMRENYGMPHSLLLPFYYIYRWLRGIGLTR